MPGSGSGDEADPWDVAIRYGREFGDFEVAAAISQWTDKSDKTGRSGSVSVLAPTGTSLTAATSSTEREGDDTRPSFSYFKLGQELDVTSAGTTAVSFGFANTSEQGGPGAGGDHFDLAVVQKIKSLGTELCGVYGVYEANIRGTTTEPITITGVGARIKF